MKIKNLEILDFFEMSISKGERWLVSEETLLNQKP